ncbi:hypothetical protein OAK90_01490, partial [bacterium]|nr:hypothetical protein [bacterium]
MIIRLAKVLFTRVLLNISAKKHLGLLVFGLVCVIGESSLQAQTTSTNSLGFNFQLPDNPQEFDLSIRIVIFFTLLA